MKKAKVGLVALGCPKALVDAEQMMASLAHAGYEIVIGDEDCDILFVNTCSFVKSARDEADDAIESALKLKRLGKVKKVVVTGCLPQMEGDTLKKKYKQVDAFLGTGKNDLVVSLLEGDKDFEVSEKNKPQGSSLPRLQLTMPHVAYLRIAEGCSHSCTFCTIPSIRGPFHSFVLADLVQEAKALASVGVKEIILIAQDTSIVGLDANPKYSLEELCKRISEIDGIKWIRIMYANPMHFSEKVLAAFNVPKVLPYFDIPFQHFSQSILSLMGRPSPGPDDIRLLIKAIRSKFQDAALRTTFITGFPSETNADFIELKNFIEETKFDKLGVFAYSKEENTLSYTMKQVPQKVASGRRNQLMELQSDISYERNKGLAGKQIECIVDQVGKEQSIARAWFDAPEIDGVVYVKGDNLKPGQIIQVKINAFSEYDLGGIKIGS